VCLQKEEVVQSRVGSHTLLGDLKGRDYGEDRCVRAA